VSQYGRRVNPSSTGDIAGGSATGYTFTGNGAVDVRVKNLSSSPATLFVLYNPESGVDASPTGFYDDELLPGQSCRSGEDRVITGVSIYSAIAATYGTHFNVRGWNL
jgi:hypothetical protein